jgi:uncharacterized repeat protein (TIGR04138 family)
MKKVPDLADLARRDGRFHAEAFAFVSQSLRHAAKLHRKDRASGADRHLSAHQLVEGALDLAVERYGLLAELVLRAWGVKASEDLGEITFALIDHGVFTKQPSDRIEDFYAGPEFADIIVSRVTDRIAKRWTSG